ncbi:MAG: 4-hydroxy-tetrahydrodipicolinate synthase [Lentimicrobiaceae bacterium]|nr:4-hydroxy-tetrahydrodipicolinate synthase [Lentimicrobiaceae bacterium]
MKNIFSGTGVALVTPFKADFSIDFQGIETMVNHVISGGVDYIVALGTTGETPALSFAERNKILPAIIETVKDRVPVVVGIGCNNPIEVNEQIHLFDLKKASAILSVAPYYNRPQQRGLIGHYKAVAEQSPLPIILYNVPSRTGVNIEAETTLQIAEEIPKVIGIKEASGCLNQIMHIIQHRPKDFLVISGDDALTLPLLACGADGVISVVANAFPQEFSTMVRLAKTGDFDNAKTMHYQLLDCMHACFMDGSPSGVKTFLQVKGLIEDHVRLPLVAVNDKTRQRIAELVKQ